MGLKSAPALQSFTEIPLFDSSGYQMLLACMKDVCEVTDQAAVVAAKEALNWCQLSEAARKTGAHAEELVGAIAEMAKTVAGHTSSYSTSSNEEECALIGETNPEGAAPALQAAISRMGEVHEQTRRLAVRILLYYYCSSSFFPCSWWSLCLSYPSIAACLHSMTLHDTSLTIIPLNQSINQSINHRHNQYSHHLLLLPYRYV
jgi:hypothetical protein